MADADGLHARFGEGALVLEPLAERHREPLRLACADDEEFWPLYPESFGDAYFDRNFGKRLVDAGYRAFALLDEGRCVGMSAYLHVDACNASLHIGGTYLTTAVRGTGLNQRVKTLMIGRAIALGFRRIEFRIDARNLRSQRALAKLGAVHEGTLRKDRVIWTGHVRDTTVWSILAEDWQG